MEWGKEMRVQGMRFQLKLNAVEESRMLAGIREKILKESFRNMKRKIFFFFFLKDLERIR